MQRKILAAFDDEGIFVYQAFKHSIADEALRKGTFGKGFNMERMTWIKPSFGWMLYRSHFAAKDRQERILKIKLSHVGFQTILSKAVSTSFSGGLYQSEADWRTALKYSEVRYQWDPDRDIQLKPLDRRALQLGIRGTVVAKYVNDWIIGMEDVTELAHAVKRAIDSKLNDLPSVVEEQPYEVNPETQQRLDMGQT